MFNIRRKHKKLKWRARLVILVWGKHPLSMWFIAGGWERVCSSAIVVVHKTWLKQNACKHCITWATWKIDGFFVSSVIILVDLNQSFQCYLPKCTVRKGSKRDIAWVYYLGKWGCYRCSEATTVGTPNCHNESRILSQSCGWGASDTVAVVSIPNMIAESVRICLDVQHFFDEGSDSANRMERFYNYSLGCRFHGFIKKNKFTGNTTTCPITSFLQSFLLVFFTWLATGQSWHKKAGRAGSATENLWLPYWSTGFLGARRRSKGFSPSAWG